MPDTAVTQSAGEPAANECRWKVGDQASITRKVRFWHINWFARITGDNNPVHLDEEVAKKTSFGRRIAHGMLSAGFISAVLGTRLPGVGSIYVSQTLNFKKPVYPGDKITTTAEVVEVKPTKKPGLHFIRLKTECKNQDGDVVLDGEAVIYYKPLEA
jgi:acyl dehydratase